ncbi:MAG: MFS transporter [Proteobacteria bacterium]|nr:MFS transporter [Pseudomonadota bacterium]
MTNAQRKAARNIRMLQIYTVCANAIFVLPVLVPYYRDVIGLGFREFMIGEAVFSALMIAMEVPTGWVSDVWGRRKTLIVSAAVQIAGWAMLLRADSFLEATAAQATLAVAVSLFSGTNSAFLYDTLLEAGREGEYRMREGGRMGLALCAVGIASLMGGVLYGVNPVLPLAATIVFVSAGFLATLAMAEPARHAASARKNPFADMAETFRYAVHGHAEVAGIILLSAMLFATTKMMLWAQQPYYIMLGMREEWFGVLTAAGFFLGGAASAFGHRLDGKISNVGALKIMMAWIVGVCVTAGLWPGYHAIPLLLSGSIVFGAGWVRVQAAINKRVSSARRATILSCASLMVHVFAMPLLVLTGLTVDRHDIHAGLMLLAALLGVGGTIAALTIKRRDNKPAVLPDV